MTAPHWLRRLEFICLDRGRDRPLGRPPAQIPDHRPDMPPIVIGPSELGELLAEPDCAVGRAAPRDRREVLPLAVRAVTRRQVRWFDGNEAIGDFDIVLLSHFHEHAVCHSGARSESVIAALFGQSGGIFD